MEIRENQGLDFHWRSPCGVEVSPEAGWVRRDIVGQAAGLAHVDCDIRTHLENQKKVCLTA